MPEGLNRDNISIKKRKRYKKLTEKKFIMAISHYCSPLLDVGFQGTPQDLPF